MNLECKVTVGNNGRIVIPSKIRSQMHIESGDKMLLVYDKELKLIPQKQALKAFQDYVQKHNKNKISLVDELIKHRREEAKND
jgi:AbrB family looped-hinge helix DNA binding protein